MQTCTTVSYFDDASDWLIKDIAKCILTFPDGCEQDLHLASARDAIRFSVTCKRMSNIINRSIDIWSNVDVGAIIREKSIRLQNFVEVALSIMRAPHTRLFRKLSRIDGLANGYILGLMISMPNLRHLELCLGRRSMCDDSLLSAIPLEYHKKLKNVFIDAHKMIEHIESMSDLRCLSIQGYPLFEIVSEYIPIKFPPTLETLELNNIDFSNFIGECKESFGSIRSLSILNCMNDITRMIGSFPGLTSLSICNHWHAGDDGSRNIWDTRSRLEELRIVDSESDNFFETFAESPRLETMRKLTLFLERPKCKVICDTVYRVCPNLEQLFVFHPKLSSKDVSALANLKKLHILKIDCDDDGDEFSLEFLKLGESDGAVPFTEITLHSVNFNIKRFFSSRRCRQLRRATFYGCKLDNDDMATLIENSRGSLERLSVNFCRGDYADFVLSLKK